MLLFYYFHLVVVSVMQLYLYAVGCVRFLLYCFLLPEAIVQEVSDKFIRRVRDWLTDGDVKFHEIDGMRVGRRDVFVEKISCTGRMDHQSS